MRVHVGKVTEEFSGLINPEIALSEKVVKLTGITNEMAEKGDSMEEILPLFLDFLGEDVIIGQNVIFDYSFIKQWAVNHRLPAGKEGGGHVKAVTEIPATGTEERFRKPVQILSGCKVQCAPGVRRCEGDAEDL